MAEGKTLINPLADLFLGAGVALFAKGITATALSKVGVQDVDLQKMGAGAVVFTGGFLARDAVPSMADGVMSSALVLTGMNVMQKYGVSDDLGLSKMGSAPATTPTGRLGAGPTRYAGMPATQQYSRMR